MAMIVGKVWGVLWRVDKPGVDEGSSRFLFWRFRWIKNGLEKVDKSMFSAD
jgi:hypothetical protein